MNRQEELLKIAKAEGFPEDAVESFVVFIGDAPYINAAGLQFKMQLQYGQGKFAVQSVMPTREEYALIRDMLGLELDAPLCVMRGEVWIEGFERPFVDYGTGCPNNMKGFIKFSAYALEMTCRRATNRAMRLATHTQMCSIDEINQGADKDEDEQPKTDATPGQLDLLKNLARSPLMTEEERSRLHLELTDGLNKKQASEFIERVKLRLDGRRNGSKPEPPAEPNADVDDSAFPVRLDFLKELAENPVLSDKVRDGIKTEILEGMTAETCEKRIAWTMAAIKSKEAAPPEEEAAQ